MTLPILISDYEHSRIEIPDFLDHDLESRTKLKEAIVALQIKNARKVLAGQTKPLYFVLIAQIRMNEGKLINGKCKV